MSSAQPAETRSLSLRQRLISLGEVVLGAFFVVGHNVLRMTPNEVPILFGLFWISSRLREGSWKVAAFRRPKSWTRAVTLAFFGAVVLQAASQFAVEPLAHHFWHQPEQTSSVISTPALDWKAALRSLLIVWTFAAVGEETGYRGYLLTRMADLGNRSRPAYLVAAIGAAVVFGFGHFYKGPTGVVDSTYSGLVLGGVYLLSGCSLWAAILTHGISDTFAVIVVWLGWAN